MRYLLLAVMLLVSGCSEQTLDARAEFVVVSNDPAPQSCKFMGQIYGSQGNWFTGYFTPNKNLEIGSLNDLRNQAAKMDANLVILIKSQSSFSGAAKIGVSQTSVVTIGNAYRC